MPPEKSRDYIPGSAWGRCTKSLSLGHPFHLRRDTCRNQRLHSQHNPVNECNGGSGVQEIDWKRSRLRSAGYHCWAEFYAPKTGWIAVDISEAWKAKQKEDYFFGSVDANRLQLTTGRDIALSPKQDGPALNYFVHPYVEVDGKPYDKLDKQFSFEAVKSSK